MNSSSRLLKRLTSTVHSRTGYFATTSYPISSYSPFLTKRINGINRFSSSASSSSRTTAAAQQTRPFQPLLPRCSRSWTKTTVTTTRYFASKPERPLGGIGTKSRVPKRDDFRFAPFAAIFIVGSITFVLLVNQRTPAPMPTIETPRSLPELPSLDREKATWTPKEVTVIFVLGGPGVGKGTQCANLVRDYGFVHLSAGDLLRAEQHRDGSKYGKLIQSYIKDGLIVPMEVTIKLLENAMQDSIKTTGKHKFLIDGFPREMGQAVKFEDAVCESLFTLFFECSEDVMLSRLMKRGETSGREDDNAESIKKRFRTFHETSMPVVDYYEKKGKVLKVDANPDVDTVYGSLKKNMTSRLKE